jgi:hypothetical protein
MQDDDEHPRLDELLSNWVLYHRIGGTRRLGVKVAGFWSAGNSDFDQMVHACDMRDAIAVDTVVWDLPNLERTAVLHVHLQAVFRTNRGESLEVVYPRARVTMSAKLRRKRID